MTKLEEAYQKLSTCFVEIKDILKEERLTKNQATVLEALSVARPVDVGTAGSIASLVKDGVADPKVAIKIMNSRHRPWEEEVCDFKWGIPPTPEAQAELDRRKAVEEDFARLKEAVFEGRKAECLSNGSVLDAICAKAGYASFHEVRMYPSTTVPESVLAQAEMMAENFHEVLAPIVISAGMQCGKVEIKGFQEYKGIYYCTFDAKVGSTSIMFKRVKV